jgi:FKBP-type peptidyl-prolyl cis-trans isomerase (trigger factor)
MIAAIQRQEDQTITLTVTMPWADVKKVRDAIVNDYTKSAELPGFRKGKAPKKLVEEKVDEEKVKEETLKKLLPQFYLQAINEQKINPVIAPRIHVEKLEEGKDWQFIAVTCEAPEIKLGTYKEGVKKITAKSKIIIPGKEPTEVSFDDIVKEILASVEVKIPKIIIEQEVERLLSQTLDEVKKLGLTLDQYLGSTGRKAEDLRKEYELKAENDIKLEFVLQKIAEEEKITVENKEVEEAIQQAKSDAEKQNLEANRYLLASILRQQKTLDFLKNL